MKKAFPRIMLISPPIVTATEEDVPRNTQMPIGLAYIAAVLEKDGYRNIEVLDAFTLEGSAIAESGFKKYHGLPPEGIKRRIEEFQPDIVGISSMYTMYSKGANLVVDIVKKVNKNIPVICGGTHATINPRMLLEDEGIGLIVKGEGEITFLEIVRAFEEGKDIYAIEGIIYKKDGKIYENPSRSLIENLDSLPFPARGYMPMEKYFDNMAKSKNYNMRHPATTVITSRGCPGKCIYCCVKMIWGSSWRARSPENIVDEIELLIKDYGVKEIHFADDCISVDKKRLFRICEEIINRKINIKWTTPAGIAIWQLNNELLRIMKKSGCYRLTFGLESGKLETLRFIGKNYSYEHARRIIKEAGRLGIWVIGTFIIGFPHETRADIQETVSFAIKSALDFVVFYTPVIFPGTVLFDEFIKENIAYDPQITGTNRAYSTKYVTEEELFQIRQEANLKFLFNRSLRFWAVLRKIRSKEDALYLGKLISNSMAGCLDKSCNKENAFGILRGSRVMKERGNSL